MRGRMREQSKLTGKLLSVFKKAKKLPDAGELIDAGVNPLYAWLLARGMKPDALHNQMDFVRRVIAAWPKAVPAPSVETVIEWLIPSQDEQAGRAGTIRLDADGYYDFCLLVKTTPDRLLPRNKPVHTSAFSTQPAPSEIIEAAVMLYRDGHVSDKTGSLLAFLVEECQKADKLDEVRLYPDFAFNQYMLEMIDRFYEGHLEENMSSVLEDDEDDAPCPPRNFASPVYLMEEETRKTFLLYERYLEDRVKWCADDLALLNNGRKYYNDIISDCVNALAPTMKGKDWLSAFHDLKHKVGLEGALDQIMVNPACVYPVRPFWYDATARLRDGRFVKGAGILKAFCEAYRAYGKVGSLEIKSHASVEAAHDDALTELMDFRTWVSAPQTKTYVRAHVHRLYIEGELADDVPEIDHRNTPVLDTPVYRLSPPSKQLKNGPK